MDDIITIEAPDIKKVAKQLKGMEEKTPTVMVKAINKTLTEVQKLMAELAQETYIVKKAAAKKTIKVKKAKASTLSGEAISSASDKIKLYGYKVSPTKPKPTSPPKIYKSQVRQKTGLKALPGSGDRSAAFVAKMQSGHTGVFQRQRGTRMKSGRGEKIAELSGLPIPMMFAGRKLADTLQDKGQNFLREEINRQIAKIQEVGA